LNLIALQQSLTLGWHASSGSEWFDQPLGVSRGSHLVERLRLATFNALIFACCAPASFGKLKSSLVPAAGYCDVRSAPATRSLSNLTLTLFASIDFPAPAAIIIDRQIALTQIVQ
jgi:hypothetical protein